MGRWASAERAAAESAAAEEAEAQRAKQRAAQRAANLKPRRAAAERRGRAAADGAEPSDLNGAGLDPYGALEGSIQQAQAERHLTGSGETAALWREPATRSFAADPGALPFALGCGKGCVFKKAHDAG